jgi:LEA14-like dessication related protein
MKTWRLTWFLAPLLLIAGCAGPAGVSIKPTIEAVDMRVGQFDREGAQVTVTLRVHNPNRVSIPLENLAAELQIQGEPVLSLKAMQPVHQLSAQSSVSIPLSGRLEFKTLPSSLSRVALSLVSGLLEVRVVGTGTTGNGLIPLRYEKSGRLEAPRRY